MKDKTWFSKNPILIIGIIVVVAVILFFVFKGTNTNTDDSNSVQPTSQNQETLNPSNTEKTTSVRKGEGYSRDNPAPINKPLITEYEQAGDPKVKAEITLIEVIRGEEALNRIKQQNYLNSNPDEGQEYLLLKIRFKLLDMSEGESEALSRYYFTIVSESGVAYDSDIGDFGATVDPEPRMDKEIFIGATHEGWVSYEVDINDKKPLLWFEPAGLSESSDKLWFKLY